MLSNNTWIGILLILIIIKYVIIQPIEDKKTYKIYAARDEFTLASIYGQINQDSKLYNFLIRYLNFWIFYAKNDYDFSILLKNILDLNKTEDFKQELAKELIQNKFAVDIIKQAESQVKWSIKIKGFIFIHLFIAPIIILLDILIPEDFGNKEHPLKKFITNFKNIQKQYNNSKKVYKEIVTSCKTSKSL